MDLLLLPYVPLGHTGVNREAALFEKMELEGGEQQFLRSHANGTAFKLL